MQSVDVCIACYKRDPFLKDAIESIRMQTYQNGSVQVYFDDEGIGTGEAFNRAIALSKADIVVLLCSDDVFTDKNVIADIMKEFENPEIVHVSRWYYQFVGEDRSPVRAWRGENVIELGNNPSGLAFRRCIMPRLTNKMFVEVAQAVWMAVYANNYSILKYDTVAVRIHNSISRTPGYYKKMWNSSPVEEWSKLGWKTNDFTHLIQVGVNFERKAVIDEAKNFIKINIWNLFNPVFWLFFIIAVITPRSILYKIPEIYRSTWGKWKTKEVKRS